MTIEVILRKNALQIGDGKNVVLSIPKQGEKHDVKKLSEYLLRLKGTYPEKDDATLLVEQDIDYENIVHVMDAVRVAEVKESDDAERQKIELFPAISIGDAP